VGNSGLQIDWLDPIPDNANLKVNFRNLLPQSLRDIRNDNTTTKHKNGRNFECFQHLVQNIPSNNGMKCSLHVPRCQFLRSQKRTTQKKLNNGNSNTTHKWHQNQEHTIQLFTLELSHRNKHQTNRATKEHLHSASQVRDNRQHLLNSRKFKKKKKSHYREDFLYQVHFNISNTFNV
jgi:hypothetical protein